MYNSILQFNELGVKKLEEIVRKFIEQPKQDIGDLVMALEKPLQELQCSLIAETLETIDEIYRKDEVRKKNWSIVRSKDTNSFMATCGEVEYKRTYFISKKTGERAYLTDRASGIESHMRISNDVVINILENASDTSYRLSGEKAVNTVYESVSYWDKEKKQSRAKRKLIGKIDPTTGEVVPTRKKKKKDEMNQLSKPGPIPIMESSHSFYGATYLFDAIGEKLDLKQDLKACFPDTYKQILSLAYYLILEDKNPLSRFPRWAATHKHPYGKSISSQRSSELFASITDDARERFFRLQGKRRSEKEYWAYDTTSISSYSKCLTQTRYGVNKDHDPLPQAGWQHFGC